MTELLLGITLGLTAGVSPGPLMTLVVTTALQRGLRSGLTVALSPLVTDAPIILLCMLVLNALPGWVTAALGIAGGLFVIFLGLETIRDARHARLEASLKAQPESPDVLPRDLVRGALVNALSPHPWLFWLGVGGPILVKAMNMGWAQVCAFLIGFFGLLIGTKILAAWLASHGRRWLTGSWYARVLVGSGLVLIALGVVLAFQGVRQIVQPA